MYLELTFDDGTKADVSLSASHTLRVIAPNDTVQEAFAFGGIKDIAFHKGEPAVESAEQAQGPAAATQPEPAAEQPSVTTDDPAVATSDTPSASISEGSEVDPALQAASDVAGVPEAS